MIFFTKRIFFLVLLILLASGVRLGFAGETYKWVDKNGIIHFSDHVPEDQDTKPDIIPDKVNAEVEDTIQVVKERPLKGEPNPLGHTVRCTFTIRGSRNIGTGFFISPNGYAVTCKHVIEENGSHTAILYNQEEYPIGVIAASDEYDLALILVTTAQRTPYIEFRDPLSMAPGEKVYAVGSSAGLQSTITDGLLTGMRKESATGKRTVQFSAPVNPGNSGGPLIDKDGKVIGVVSWKLLSNNGVPVTGIGFAVPSDYVLEEYRGYTNQK